MLSKQAIALAVHFARIEHVFAPIARTTTNKARMNEPGHRKPSHHQNIDRLIDILNRAIVVFDNPIPNAIDITRHRIEAARQIRYTINQDKRRICATDLLYTALDTAQMHARYITMSSTQARDTRGCIDMIHT
jgi:hypothetical protein